ncbi:MAG: glycosyltransferase [Pseudomonadota bacterium]
MDGSRQHTTDSAVPSELPQPERGTQLPAQGCDKAGDPPHDSTVPDGAVGRLVVGIPSLGRADILTPTVRALAGQSRVPDRVVLSVTGAADYAPHLAETVPFPVEIIEGSKGGCTQRNRILETLEPNDILLLLDDDFLMAEDYLERLEALFAAHSDIVMLTGMVVADGAVGPGFAHEHGVQLLRAALAKEPSPPQRLKDTWNGYGCNFACRASVVCAHNLRFDEKLPLYGWLEDVDFSSQLETYGRLCEASELRGVHLGVKVARSPGRRLGYSQVANPIYLYRKSTMRFVHAREMLVRNMLSNLIYSVWPRPWADSRGRLVGNLLALWDLARGRLDPERIRDL